MVTQSAQAWRMVGRARELQVLERLLDGVHERGQALLLLGEAGIGKSSLVSAAASGAAARGFQVLSTTGVQAEAHLPFAGLHQLLRPILGRVEELPGPQRAAMRAAFGISDQAAPEFFFIALAVLDLLADAAAQAPLLLVVEDVQWLDRPTLDVVSFVARRLESEPTIVLATARSGPRTGRSESEFPELLIEALDDEASRALLHARAPDLPAEVRERILADAGGNPLALVELPTALQAGAGEPVVVPAVLPLTARLERAFAARMSELAEPARTLLLAAAIDDADGVLVEVLAVAELIDGVEVGAEAVEAAVTAGLVENDGVRIRFRHPLVRSAVYHATDLPRRRAVHASWAQVLDDQPDRQVWHRAASRIQADEELAVALEETAARAQRRGALPMAISALERAAQLSPDPVQQGDRLLRAAELAVELGRRDILVRLLEEAGRLDLGPRDRSRVAFLQGVFDDATPGDAESVQGLLDLADWARERGDTELTLRLLTEAARRCWWGDPGPEIRAAVAAAGERMAGLVDADDPRVFGILAVPDPLNRGAEVMRRVHERIAGEQPLDTDRAVLFGVCLYVVGDFARAHEIGVQAITELRHQGRLALLAQLLVMRALSGIYVGEWVEARTAAEEGGRLARETDQPIWEVVATVAEQMLAGVRSEREVTEVLDEVQAWAAWPVVFSSILAAVQTARGLAALGSGRPEAAVDHFRRALDPEDPSYRHKQRCWVIGFLAEAAVLSGQPEVGRAAVAGLEEAAAISPSPMLQQGMAYARAVLAESDAAEALFATALADPELPSWPFPRARLLLAYGSWLRRQRRVAESRGPLREARDLLDELGAVQWGDRARAELRAAGEASRRRRPEAKERLSPQELQIARMAAEGLSNREIGQRLYLSHRTVGSHLYRIFPKLEVTARSQLRAALGP